MITHDFGSNYTLPKIKEILECGMGYVCELHTNVPFLEEDYIVFDGIAHTYAFWKSFLNVKNETNDGQQD